MICFHFLAPWQCDGKAASPADLTFHMYLAAMHVHELLYKGQSQAGTIVLTGEAAIDLYERIEQSSQILTCDSDACIGHAEADVTFLRIRLYIQHDPSMFRREFDRICQQVD